MDNKEIKYEENQIQYESWISYVFGKIFLKEYFTPGRIVVLVILGIAGLFFMVLDFQYYILPPVWVNPTAGQDRTILDIGRSLSIALCVMSTYFVFTRFRHEPFLARMAYMLLSWFISYCVGYSLAFTFIVIIVYIFGF